MPWLSRLVVCCAVVLGLHGCAVVTIGAAVAGAALTVGGAVVGAGVKVTGKVIEKTIDAVTPDSTPASE